jgi:hypothetical protein
MQNLSIRSIAWAFVNVLAIRETDLALTRKAHYKLQVCINSDRATSKLNKSETGYVAVCLFHALESTESFAHGARTGHAGS